MRLKRFISISSNNKKKLTIIFLILIIFLALFISANYFYVKEIILISDDSKTKIIGISSLKNKNLLLLNLTELEKEIIQKNPGIKSVKMTKLYPNKLRLKITKDWAVVAVKADLGYLYLSDNGKIISKKKTLDEKLPQIIYYQKVYFANYQSGQKINYKEISMVLELLKKAENLGLIVDTVDIVGTYMVAFNLEEKKIIFSLEKKLEEQEYQLETIIKQFRIEGREFISLDLRFNKPVIKVK